MELYCDGAVSEIVCLSMLAESQVVSFGEVKHLRYDQPGYWQLSA
jgi:hypothetical protein